MEHYMIYVTTGSEEEAKKIGKALLNKHLVACANLIPAVRSLYRWKDQIEDDQEVLMILKTHKDRYNEVETTVKEHHSYECPEIIATPIREGEQAYLDWIFRETRS